MYFIRYRLTDCNLYLQGLDFASVPRFSGSLSHAKRFPLKKDALNFLDYLLSLPYNFDETRLCVQFMED